MADTDGVEVDASLVDAELLFPGDNGTWVVVSVVVLVVVVVVVVVAMVVVDGGEVGTEILTLGVTAPWEEL